MTPWSFTALVLFALFCAGVVFVALTSSPRED